MNALGRSLIAWGVASAIVVGSGTAAGQPNPDAGGEAAADAGTGGPRPIDRALELDREGKPVEAARILMDALAEAPVTGQEPEQERARLFMAHLRTRVARVRFDVPPDVIELVIEVDGRPVPSDGHGKSYAINPGRHQVRARALRAGVPVTLDQAFSVSPLEVHTVWLEHLAAEACTCSLPPPCLREARDEEEARRCMTTGRVRAGCGGCGASSGAAREDGWVVPFAIGWLAYRRRRALSRSAKA